MTERRISTSKHAVLKLGERNYAFDMDHVQEIIPKPVLEPCFDGPELLIGMFESTHGTLPVLDLLNRPPDECCLNLMSLVVLEESGETICILADDILDYVELNPCDCCPLPDGANGVTNDLLNGVVNQSDCDYYMLDLGTLRITCKRVEDKTEIGNP